jgi:protein-S-isoprenylcysteine O-methyltransferase Ste14
MHRFLEFPGVVFEKWMAGDLVYVIAESILWITTLLLLSSVVYKFIDYSDKRRTRKTRETKAHGVETFSMALVIIILFNLLQSRIGVIAVDSITQWMALAYGSVLAGIGVVLHLWSKKVIGRYWSNRIEILEEHTILTIGPYAVVRHPMYSSLILWLIGLSFIFMNGISFLLTWTVFVPMMIFRSTAEDRLLMELDKASFGVYRRSVHQLLPGFDGFLSLFLRLLVIVFLGFSLVTNQMSAQRFVLLFVVHLGTGLLLRIPKIRFSYINKSFIMALIFFATCFFPQAHWLYYLILIFDIWGLFFNCPCMMIYEKYHGCPCFNLVKSCAWKGKE